VEVVAGLYTVLRWTLRSAETVEEQRDKVFEGEEEEEEEEKMMANTRAKGGGSRVEKVHESQAVQATLEGVRVVERRRGALVIPVIV